MGISIKINDIDRTGEVDARSLSITDELTSRVNSASFIFTTNDKTVAPIAGQTVLIEEGLIKLFSGRVLSKEESFLPPNLLTYNVGCIDYTRDLDKNLVVESYSDMLAGDIIKDILTKYTTGFTAVHVQNGLTVTKMDFDYAQVSQALTTIAETCGYEWYVDYDKDIWFFFKTDYPAPFQLDDNQGDYRDLIISYDVSQLRNRVYIKSALLADVFHKDDEDSIAAIQAIEGGDGIFEHCITNNSIDIEEWALDVANADLLQNANPIIKGTFTTNRKDIRSGQIITVDSDKRNIHQDFLVQTVNLMQVDTVIEYGKSTEMLYKPAAIAEIGYKPTVSAEIPYNPAGGLVGTEVTYYVYEVTIATHLKGLEDLLLQLIYQSNESIKRDKIPPAVPDGLILTTGMGEVTQASLAWMKAAWDANIEDDFSHYELKYKKTAYSDFGTVTTADISFLWTGLEQGVEYEVSICAVDIYGNRSDWSDGENIVTAVDTATPAQIAGAVATALLAGIKVAWTKSSENNVAGYAVERQESSNGTTWTGVWTEKVRTDTTMWLDLLLPYTMYYRYRIKAFTRTGTEGATSTPTADSIKANKAGANDIVAGSITGNEIAANTITANKYNQLRNTYVFNGDDSLDANYPFELDFEIVSEMTSIVNIKLSFRIRHFRSYATASLNSIDYTSGSKDYGSPSVWATGSNTMVVKTITVASGHVTGQTSAAVSMATHTHKILLGQHNHSIGPHVHGLDYGIYEEITTPTIHFHIDNGSGYGAASANYTTDQLDLAITGAISGVGFKRIKFESDVRCRIAAWVLCKVDITA